MQHPRRPMTVRVFAESAPREFIRLPDSACCPVRGPATPSLCMSLLPKGGREKRCWCRGETRTRAARGRPSGPGHLRSIGLQSASSSTTRSAFQLLHRAWREPRCMKRAGSWKVGFLPVVVFSHVAALDRCARVAAGGARRGLMPGRSSLRADCSALLGPGSRRPTRYVRCAHCAQTGAPSQLLMHATRAEPGPALLLAPEIAPTGHRLPRRVGCFRRENASPQQQRRVRAGPRRASEAPRSAGLAASRAARVVF